MFLCQNVGYFHGYLDMPCMIVMYSKKCEKIQKYHPFLLKNYIVCDMIFVSLYV